MLEDGVAEVTGGADRGTDIVDDGVVAAGRAGPDTDAVVAGRDRTVVDDGVEKAFGQDAVARGATVMVLLFVNVVRLFSVTPVLGLGSALPSVIVPLLMIVAPKPNDTMPSVEAAPVMVPLLVTRSLPMPSSSMPEPPAARLIVPVLVTVTVLALMPKIAIPA